METVDQGKFSCSKCGKSYKWKQELAGKKVKCKCGNVMTAPAEEPVAEQQDVDLDGLYELAADEKKSAKKQREEPVGFRCPSCNGDLTPGAVVCTSCGFNLKTGSRATTSKQSNRAPTLAYAGGGGAVASTAVAPNVARGVPSAMAGYGQARKGLQKDDRAEKEGALYDLYLPIGLIIFGLIGSLAEHMWFQRSPISMGEAMVVIGIGLIVDLVLIAIACLAAIKIMDVAFGSPGTAALKIVAISIAPQGLANIVSYLIGDPIGLVGWALALGLYYALFYYLFDLDGGEIMLLTALIWFVRTWVGMFIAGVLIALIMGGGLGGSGGSMLASAADAADGSGDGEISHDQHVKDMLDLYELPEVGPWLAESPNRIFGQLGRVDTEKMATDLKDMGAKKMYVNAKSSQAGEIFVEMPKDKDQRKEMLAYHGQYTGDPPMKDKGQKWLVFEFDY